MQVCPNCGERNPDHFRVCGICGGSLAPAVAREGVRKTVTVVFCDLKDSTSLGEKLDTETLREVLSEYFTEMKAVLESHGGTIEKFIGDAVMAVFGFPRAHEDDALRAVRAAVGMKLALARLNERFESAWGIRLEHRIGVNTGEVVAGDVTVGQRLVTGDTVNTAARLEQAAPAMEILIGAPTYRLVRDAVEVEQVEPLGLKGKAQRVPAYRLLAVVREEGLARRLDAPMVGRVRELQMLADALTKAIKTEKAQLITVFGPAGVGKSRLLREFTERVKGFATSLHGRCLPYGDGITFWPLAEAVREAAGITEDDSLQVARSKLSEMSADLQSDVTHRLEAAVGLDSSTFPVRETFWAAGRLFEALGKRQPLVVQFEDIHWAEKTFIDLVHYLSGASVDAPLLVICTARPELKEDYPDWSADRALRETVSLPPLSRQDSSLIVDNLLGTTSLDDRARKLIIEASEGNPLFVEQMLSMLIDEGALERDEWGRWVLLTEIGSLTIPPSISALLTARLDRLAPSERAVLERASVVGQVFYRGAVEELVPRETGPQVGPALQKLVEKELIVPEASTFAGQETYRFLHILIRDKAYFGLLKRTRADLHECFVDWLERSAPDRLMEYEEIRGYHLEQAHKILTQLGRLDDHAVGVGARGASYLSSAGHRALARGDMPAATNLLRRTEAMTPKTDAARLRLLLEVGEALTVIGDFSLADSVLEEAAEESRNLHDEGLAITAELARLHLHYVTDPESTRGQVIDQAEESISVLEKLGSHEGLARAWRLLTFVHWAACRYGLAEQTAVRMIYHARLAQDELMVARELPALAVCAEYGPMAAAEAVARCEAVLEEVKSDRKGEALILASLAHLEAMRGHFARARRLYRRSRSTLEELGWNLQAALTSLVSGEVEMLAGDPEAAEGELRSDYEMLDGMGERNYISTTAAFLSEALYEQGRFEEAAEFSSRSEKLAAPDDISSQFQWRCVAGKVEARRGRFEQAEVLVRRAVELIGATDELDSQASTLMDLAEVLTLADRTAEAIAAATEAEKLFRSKGNIVSEKRAKGLAEALATGTPPVAVIRPPDL